MAQNFAFPEIRRITAEKLKMLMDGGENLLVVDTRAEADYNLGHLPNALNISVSCGEPEPEQDEVASVRLMSLPRDRLIVLY